MEILFILKKPFYKKEDLFQLNLNLCFIRSHVISSIIMILLIMKRYKNNDNKCFQLAYEIYQFSKSYVNNSVSIYLLPFTLYLYVILLITLRIIEIGFFMFSYEIGYYIIYFQFLSQISIIYTLCIITEMSFKSINYQINCIILKNKGDNYFNIYKLINIHNCLFKTMEFIKLITNTFGFDFLMMIIDYVFRSFFVILSLINCAVFTCDSKIGIIRSYLSTFFVFYKFIILCYGCERVNIQVRVMINIFF